MTPPPKDELIRAIVQHANETGHVQGLRAYVRRLASDDLVEDRHAVTVERMIDEVIALVARIALEKRP